MNRIYFVIVGDRGQPVFELELYARDSTPVAAMSSSSASPDSDVKQDDYRNLSQFIAHAALDLVDAHQCVSPQMYLKNVDRFNEWSVSAFLAASGTRFVLLHPLRDEQRKDDAEMIRSFFMAVYECYIKLIMNPLYDPTTPIRSASFRERCAQIARRNLNIPAD